MVLGESFEVIMISIRVSSISRVEMVFILGVMVILIMV